MENIPKLDWLDQTAGPMQLEPDVGGLPTDPAL